MILFLILTNGSNSLKIELEKGVWLASPILFGDPPRTLRQENAREFPDMASAQKALKKARKFQLFLDAQIVEDFF